MSLNRSIKNTISRCEREKKNPIIIENLKKLFIYGTFEEKMDFINSTSYVFPKRFTNLELKDGLLLESTKGQLQVCEETNCRVVEDCAIKKRCEVVTGCLCSGIIGLIGVYVCKDPVIGFIGSAASDPICTLVEEEVCEDVKECDNVLKCDTICHWENSSDIQHGECVNTPYGMLCQ
ncbi:MAG: hypothetical protein K6357_06460 [Elusimicrobiota bacterium]